MATQKEELKLIPGKSNYDTEKVCALPGYARRSFFLWDENKSCTFQGIQDPFRAWPALKRTGLIFPRKELLQESYSM